MAIRLVFHKGVAFRQKLAALAGFSPNNVIDQALTGGI